MCMQLSVLLAAQATAANWLEHVSTFMAPMVSELAIYLTVSLQPHAFCSNPALCTVWSYLSLYYTDQTHLHAAQELEKLEVAHRVG